MGVCHCDELTPCDPVDVSGYQSSLILSAFGFSVSFIHSGSSFLHVLTLISPPHPHHSPVCYYLINSLCFLYRSMYTSSLPESHYATCSSFPASSSFPSCFLMLVLVRSGLCLPAWTLYPCKLYSLRLVLT